MCPSNNKVHQDYVIYQYYLIFNSHTNESFWRPDFNPSEGSVRCVQVRIELLNNMLKDSKNYL